MTETLERFCSGYLENWDRRSTVRRLERFRPSREDAAGRIVPDSLLPFAGSLTRLGLSDEAASHYAGLQCYRFMEEIALVESDVVVRLCHLLANRYRGWDIPFAARQVAMTVATDESYHALVAREFMDDVRRLTGIEPHAMPERCAVDAALAAVCDGRLDGAQDDFRIVALCLAENAIVDELVGLERGTEPNKAFDRLLKEHLLDEGRHRAFFQQVLTAHWAALDETTRARIATVLPDYLDRWLARDGPWEDALSDLCTAGLAPEAAGRLRQSQCGARSVFSDHPMWRPVADALRIAGIDRHPDLRAALSCVGGRAEAA